MNSSNGINQNNSRTKMRAAITAAGAIVTGSNIAVRTNAYCKLSVASISTRTTKHDRRRRSRECN